MKTQTRPTKPKPFVFVLMPLDSKFDDIYKFGIKGAAEEANAYAERVDEQIFTEGILERIFNQINKADVIVADMTDRNPNVFYEVGYAHALNKIVLLLTQRAEDIPFDLQHHQHTIYGGKIDVLRNDLASKIEWAVKESATRRILIQKAPYEISIRDVYLPAGFSAESIPLVSTITAIEDQQSLDLVVRNSSAEPSDEAIYIYLFSRSESILDIYGFFPDANKRLQPRLLRPQKAHASDAPDELSQQHRLPVEIPVLPPGASEQLSFAVSIRSDWVDTLREESLRLRIHSGRVICDYRFSLDCKKTE